MGDLIKKNAAPVAANTSPGVTPGVVYSRSGTINPGTYLKIGDVISSSCGHPIFGKNRIVKLRATNSIAVTSNCILRLQLRTGINTFVDIAGAQITILAGTYQATVELDVALPNDPEVVCYFVSGSQLSNVVLNMFLYPDYS